MKGKDLTLFWRVSLICLILGVAFVLLRHFGIIPVSTELIPQIYWVPANL